MVCSVVTTSPGGASGSPVMVEGGREGGREAAAGRHQTAASPLSQVLTLTVSPGLPRKSDNKKQLSSGLNSRLQFTTLSSARNTFNNRHLFKLELSQRNKVTKKGLTERKFDKKSQRKSLHCDQPTLSSGDGVREISAQTARLCSGGPHNVEIDCNSRTCRDRRRTEKTSAGEPSDFPTCGGRCHHWCCRCCAPSGPGRCPARWSCTSTTRPSSWRPSPPTPPWQ